MEETAMKYENIIRAVFQCGRGGHIAADADIYRYLENRSLQRKDIKNVYEFGLAYGVVIAYIATALDKIRNERKDNKEFCSKIDKCFKDHLSMIMEKGDGSIDSLFDESMKNIDLCVNEAYAALNEIGLY